MRLATWRVIGAQLGLFRGEAMVISLPNPEVVLLNVASGMVASQATWDSKEDIWLGRACRKLQATGSQGPGLWPCGQPPLAPHSLGPAWPGEGLLSWARACSHSLGHDFRFNW